MSARHVMLPHIGCADGNCIICKTLLNGNDLDNSYRDGKVSRRSLEVERRFGFILRRPLFERGSFSS